MAETTDARSTPKDSPEPNPKGSPKPTDNTTTTPAPRPKTRAREPKPKLKTRTTKHADTDIDEREALRRRANNERIRRSRLRKVEREIASGLRGKDGKLKKSTERPWC